MNTPKHTAFTLVELLVVVAIIALLLGILLPALGRAREKAKIVVCRTNIRTLATGFQVYAAANNNRVFPKRTKDSVGQDLEVLWLTWIGEQMGNIDDVRDCPTTEINPNTTLTWPNGLGTAKYGWIWPYGSVDSSGKKIPNNQVTREQAEYGSYGYNGWLYDNERRDHWSYPYYWNTASPDEASQVPLFSDCRWVDGWPEDTDTCPADFDINAGANGNSMQRFLINRHEGRLNMGFVDGHVEDIKLADLWSLKWSRLFETKGPQTRTDGSPIYQPD